MGPLDFSDEEIREMEDEEQCLLRFSRLGEIEVIGGTNVYSATDEDGATYDVDEEHYRIIDQYEAARRRQAEAEALAERRWKKPPPEPDPADVAPAEKLTDRQEEFCRHYAARPVATHAALLAGYAEENARHQGSRLLKNPLVLARIEALRAERGVRHALDAGTLQDKLEAVFVDALTVNNHGAAVAALRLQAGLARLPTRAALHEEAPRDEPRDAGQRAEKSRGRGRKKPTKADK